MHTKHFLILGCAAALLLAGVAIAADPPATAPALSARQLIDKLTTDVIAILRDPANSKDQRRDKVREIAYQNMDFETLSRLTLGRHWREINAAQQADFLTEYKKHLTNTYGHTTDEYTDEDINVTGDRLEPDGDSIVQTRIIGSKDGGPRQEIAKVDYRLRNKNGSWKIIDVTIDGVSLVANFRSQFQEIIANGGFDNLIKLLREKNATGEK